MNLFGEPLDGLPPFAAREYRTILAKPGPLNEVRASTEVLETGIKVIDLLCPFIREEKPACSAEQAWARPS